jgi:hypothetical protein
MIEIDLTPEQAVDPRLFTLPDDRVYGDRPESELRYKRIRVTLGERPTARNVRKMFSAEKKRLPAALKVYSAYEIWLIGVTVGVTKEGGWQSVVRLGLEIELPAMPRFTIVGLAPETRMISRGKLGLECHAEIGANGAIAVPHAVSASAGVAPIGTIDASAAAKVAAEGGLNLSFSVLTPAVIAIGKGDRRAQWILEDADGPLLGDQEVFFTVLTPLTCDTISMKARVSATVATFDLIPSLCPSAAIDLEAVLD